VLHGNTSFNLPRTYALLNEHDVDTLALDRRFATFGAKPTHWGQCTRDVRIPKVSNAKSEASLKYS